MEQDALGLNSRELLPNTINTHMVLKTKDAYTLTVPDWDVWLLTFVKTKIMICFRSVFF